MNMISAVLAGMVALAVIAAVAVLTWHGDITGEAAVAIYSILVGGGSVGAAAHVAVKTGADAATTGTYAANPSTIAPLNLPQSMPKP